METDHRKVKKKLGSILHRGSLGWGRQQTGRDSGDPEIEGDSPGRRTQVLRV